jgi:hypothetical protein
VSLATDVPKEKQRFQGENRDGCAEISAIAGISAANMQGFLGF